MPFQKATKKQAKLRLALIGPSGSGKTYTALTLATYLVPGGRIALIDTEHGSASLYADQFQFDVLELDSFSVENYIAGITEAEASGYDVLIIDSLSHAWTGKDGVLEYKDKMAAATSSKDDFGAWRKASPKHNSLVDRMLSARLHLIATMRVKTDYVVERGADGKNHPRKVGLQPVQRDGVEYEFGVIADIDADHNFIVSKSRCSALTDMVVNKAGKEIADILRQWLTDGVAADPLPTLPVPASVVPPIVSPPPANGNGRNGKPATIKTPKWGPAAKALAEHCPCYKRADGQPDQYQMTTVAAQCEFSEITEANLEAVIAALSKHAEQVMAAA
jgi:hypothetical protein